MVSHRWGEWEGGGGGSGITTGFDITLPHPGLGI